MKTCPFCGSNHPDDAAVCENCGIVFASLNESADEIEQAQTRTIKVGKGEKLAASKRARPRKNGGLFGWSLANLLLVLCTGITGLIEWKLLILAICMIPGIMGLVCVVNINGCSTFEEQEKKEDFAVMWNILGSGLFAALLVIGHI